MPVRLLLAILLIAAPGPTVAGQSAARSPRLEGTWRADLPDGPREIVVRPDSSASFGDETVRWRLVADSIFIALGDEWLVYQFALRGRNLTLSGGDLEEPITLRRMGPATPRPEGVAVPPAPPMDRRAIGR